MLFDEDWIVLACGGPEGIDGYTNAFIRIEVGYFYFDIVFDSFYHLGRNRTEVLVKRRRLCHDQSYAQRFPRTSLADVEKNDWKSLLR